MAGKLIVLEGMDGAGTTTQAQLLVNHLEGQGATVVMSAEPTKSAIGREARRLLASPIEGDQDLLVSLALCFAADRMQHVHDVIAPSLHRGDLVVLDRYVMSSLVYQGLHLPSSFVREINRYAIKPDLTIVLDVDATIAFDRLKQRGSTKDFYETPATLLKIKNRYLQFADDEPGKTVVIDANKTVEIVHERILAVLAEKAKL
jgi:dTMP kinase